MTTLLCLGDLKLEVLSGHQKVTGLMFYTVYMGSSMSLSHVSNISANSLWVRHAKACSGPLHQGGFAVIYV